MNNTKKIRVRTESCLVSLNIEMDTVMGTNRKSDGMSLFAAEAECTTHPYDRYWVYAKSPDMSDCFAIEKEGSALVEACEDRSYNALGLYAMWGGRPVPKYNFQKSPVRTRY